MGMYFYMNYANNLRMLFCQLNISASPRQNNSFNFLLVFEIFDPSSETCFKTAKVDKIQRKIKR